MTVSIPKNALIVIADGEHAVLFRNTGDRAVKLESAGDLIDRAANDSKPDHGASRTPHETSKQEQAEAGFARRIAEALYQRVHKDEADRKAIVLVADPQTLGQIRPLLHKEVTARIVLELPRDLIKSPVADIDKILAAAHAA
jgi:protein required for attachment to host cells